MRLVILGPPGAGKGTQCHRLAATRGLPHVGAGAALREIAEQQNELGQEVRAALEAGSLVEDRAVVAVIRERLSRPDAKNGFLLDGFPRNRKQALALGRALSADGQWLDHVILLEVPDEVALRRLAGRVEDAKTGKVYHRDFAPPPPDIQVRQRTGDNREAHRRSLQEFRDITEPMLQIYQDRDLLLRVDATGAPDDVAERLADAIGTIG